MDRCERLTAESLATMLEWRRYPSHPLMPSRVQLAYANFGDLLFIFRRFPPTQRWPLPFYVLFMTESPSGSKEWPTNGLAHPEIALGIAEEAIVSAPRKGKARHIHLIASLLGHEKVRTDLFRRSPMGQALFEQALLSCGTHGNATRDKRTRRL